MLRKIYASKRKRAFAVLLLLLGFSPPAFAAYEEEPNETEDFFELSIEELMEVEVTITSKKDEKMFETPSAVYVLTREDIRRSGVTNIPDALRMVPGMQVGNFNANKWAISARGFNSEFGDKLLVLIDGRSVYTSMFAGVYWDEQDVILEDIERIEVVKGPGGTLWGSNAVNGIINIVTMDAKKTQGTIITGGGGIEERAFTSFRHGLKLNDKSYGRIYSKYYNRDGGIYTANGGVGADDSEKLQSGFRFDWEESDIDHITLQGDAYHGRSGRNSTEATSAGNITNKDDSENIRGLNVLSRWNRKLSETSNMSLQFYYDRSARYSFSLEHTIDIFDLDFQHRFELNPQHNFVWGLGYRDIRDNTSGTFAINFFPQDRIDKIFSGFVQDEITITENLLKFIIGSKFERNNYTGFEYQPSMRLLWTPNKNNTVWAAFTRAVQIPARSQSDMVNIFSNIPPFIQLSISGSDDLQSQELKAYEIGYRTKVGDRMLLDITAFYNEYDHLFSIEGGAAGIFDNKIYAETYGTEFAAHLQATRNWKLIAGYSFLQIQAHRKSSSTSMAKEVEYEGNSPHNMFQLRSLLDLPCGLEFDTSLYYVDNLPNSGVPKYIRMDVRLGWKVGDNLEVSVAGQNLLDREHREFMGVSSNTTESQRVIHAKLTWRF